MTRQEWEDWARELIDAQTKAQLVETIADMGEQVDMLHDVRMAAWGGKVAAPVEVPAPPIPTCTDCGQRVVRRLGAWWCPTHRDNGTVTFVGVTPTRSEP